MHYDDMDEAGKSLYRMEREASRKRRLLGSRRTGGHSPSPYTQAVRGINGTTVYRSSFFRPLDSDRID